jgi:hypothetical protein
MFGLLPSYAPYYVLFSPSAVCLCELRLASFLQILFDLLECHFWPPSYYSVVSLLVLLSFFLSLLSSSSRFFYLPLRVSIFLSIQSQLPSFFSVFQVLAFLQFFLQCVFSSSSWPPFTAFFRENCVGSLCVFNRMVLLLLLVLRLLGAFSLWHYSSYS